MNKDLIISITIVVAFALSFTLFIEVFFTFGQVFLLLIFLSFSLFLILGFFVITVFFGFL